MKFPASTRVRVALAATALAAGLAVFLFAYPQNQPKHPPKVTANDFSGRPTACLATDSATAAKTDAVTKIWAAMQDSAKPNTDNVQQLITPAAEPAQAQSYLAGLINQHCDLIVTIGRPFGQAISPLATASPSTRFIAIDAGLSQPPPDTALVSTDDALTAVPGQIAELHHH